VAPIFKAKEIFTSLNLNFEEQLGWYAANAYAICEPGLFLLFKPIEIEAGDDQWNAPNPDCWYVHCAVGELGAILSRAPYALPKVAFRRWKQKGNPLKVYDWDALVRHA